MPQLHPIDLSELLRPYQGKWVALSQDETQVLGSGATIDEALDEARRKGERQPIVIRVSDSIAAYLL